MKRFRGTVAIYLYIWCFRHLKRKVGHYLIFSPVFFSFFSYMYDANIQHTHGRLDIRIEIFLYPISHLKKKGRGEKRLVFCRAISIAPESFASSRCLLNSWPLNFSRGARGFCKTLAIVAPPRGDVSLPFTISIKENSKIQLSESNRLQ